MNEKYSKRKFKESSSSCSDLDSSTLTNSFNKLAESFESFESIDSNESLETVVEEKSTNKNQSKSQKKTEKRKKKKQKIMSSPAVGSSASCLSLETKLDKIDQKLSKMLTKEDRSFIKEIIIETVEEMKEKLLGSVVKRIEIIEEELHEKGVSTSKIIADLNAQKLETQDKLEKTEEKIGKENKLQKAEFQKLKETVNDLEQYSRRNNLRVVGIEGDEEKQSSDKTTQQFLTMCKNNLNIELDAKDIDIAHRVGKFKQNKYRPILVKFVRRQTKIELKQNGKLLKGTGIYLNDDLTQKNQDVLMSLRLKDTSRVKSAWSFEGKIFATFKSTNPLMPENTYTRQIRFHEYDQWLSLSWPTKEQDISSDKNLTVVKA